MNKLYVLVLLILFSSCKRNSSTTESSANASFVDLSYFDNSKIKVDTLLLNSYNNNDLKSFYKKYNFEIVWDASDNRIYILNELAAAGNEGLEAEDYSYSKLKSYETNYQNLKDSAIADYDVLLTLNTQLYIKHVSQGKLNPKELYDDWDIKEKNTDINAILFNCIDNANFKTAIENCKPNHPIYKQLQSCLKLLNLLPDDQKIGLVNLKEKILPNKKNWYIPIVKRRLMYWNDLTIKDTILSTLYDKNTQEAIKHFQARHGLKPDAVIGRSTIDALNFYRNQRIEQVIANMERWKWYAREFESNYLLINIPDYSIVAVKNGDTLQNQRIVVGKSTRKTPILDSKISNINLNPNWTVPPTILREDIFPEAIKNKSVFRQKGLLIINNQNEEVSPWNWTKADAYKYKYVQNPGRNNSLGLMKINFPNKYSVYLHDTNHRDYFSLNYRSLSSGCVRLEKPLDMAVYILNDTIKWPLQKIMDTTDINHYYKLQKKKQIAIDKKNAKLLAKSPKMIIEKKTLPKPQLKTIVLKVPEEIYIHQLYWTAWESKEILQFREDIYCLDSDLYSKLRY